MKNKIYIISLSPAIDYILNFKEFKINSTNRPYSTDMYASGKGIHISMILNSLDYVNNESIVFINGFFKDYYKNSLQNNGVNYKEFKSEGEIRINLKLVDNNQTESSATACSISNDELEKMLNYLRKNLNEDDIVIATGSLPKNCPIDIYAKICEITNSKKAKCLIDAFGKTLLKAIEKKPFLIKPNILELEQTLNKKLNSIEEIINEANKLLTQGAQNILVSMGSKGAIFINKKIKLHCKIYNWNNKLINVAGAGDSMLGGFVQKYLETLDYTMALKNGVICGSATAYSTRIADKQKIKELSFNFNDLEVINLK